MPRAAACHSEIVLQQVQRIVGGSEVRTVKCNVDCFDGGDTRQNNPRRTVLITRRIRGRTYSVEPRWSQRKNLKLLEEELMIINRFERLYENHSHPTEEGQLAHIARQTRRAEVLAKIERLRGSPPGPR